MAGGVVGAWISGFRYPQASVRANSGERMGEGSSFVLLSQP